MKDIIGLSVFAIISLILALTVGVFTAIVKSPVMTDRRCKEYVLANKDRIVKEEHGLVLPCTDLGYYEDATLRLLPGRGNDSTYQIIFWGDRKNWKWNFKLDKALIVDVPYNRHKGKDVDLDVEVLTLIKSK